MTDNVRQDLLRVLKDWERGVMTAQGVQSWARETSVEGADVYVQMVIKHLRELGQFLVTTEDIETYCEGFDLTPEDAVSMLKAAGSEFDVKARATDLVDDPFYGPHTRAILKDLT